MFYLHMTLITIYILVALRVYSIYVPKCTSSMVGKDTLSKQTIRAILSLLWLPILILVFVAILIAIIYIAYGNGTVSNTLKLIQRK